MKTVFACMLAVVPLTAVAASDTTPAPAKEASIPFVRSEGVLDWKADRDKGLFVRGTNGKWYYARTQGNCPRLATADTLGFETAPDGELDKFSAIRAQGWRCPLASVMLSAAPPPKIKSVG